jgi:type VI protein secretion system component VasA
MLPSPDQCISFDERIAGAEKSLDAAQDMDTAQDKRTRLFRTFSDQQTNELIQALKAADCEIVDARSANFQVEKIAVYRNGGSLTIRVDENGAFAPALKGEAKR